MRALLRASGGTGSAEIQFIRWLLSSLPARLPPRATHPAFWKALRKPSSGPVWHCQPHPDAPAPSSFSCAQLYVCSSRIPCCFPVLRRTSFWSVSSPFLPGSSHCQAGWHRTISLDRFIKSLVLDRWEEGE